MKSKITKGFKNFGKVVGSVIITLSFLSSSAYAAAEFVGPNDLIVSQRAANKYEKLERAYEHTLVMVKVLSFLNGNEEFKKITSLDEMGSKYYTYQILKVFEEYLKGWKPYSDTRFNNNTEAGGVEKILKDRLDNSFLSLPQQIKNQIKKSIQTDEFVELANKILRESKNVNGNNIAELMKDLYALTKNYVNEIKELNLPILKRYNNREYLEKYRIENKVSVDKALIMLENALVEIYNKFYQSMLGENGGVKQEIFRP